MNIPDKATKLILLQRTRYLKKNKIISFLEKIDFTSTIYKINVAVQCGLYRQNIKQRYIDDLYTEFNTFRKELPAHANSFLDIGSGVAGIDVLICKFYNHSIDVHLLDKNEIENTIYYSFNERTAFYNSFDIAKEILTSNGVAEKNVYLHDASNPKRAFEYKYDLITSFMSWGFHYPVEMYIDDVKNSLNEGGVLLLDVRKNSSGLQILKDTFAEIETLTENDRRVFVKATNSLI